jgi:hypothetical protein
MSYARFAGPPEGRAANADRDRAMDVLTAGFAEGRLTKDEYDERAARVLAARTYGELAALVADLPAGPLGGVAPYPVPQAPVNSLAVAALACGIGVFLTSGLTAIPAIALGHAARQSVRRTGERGAGMALAGIIIGWSAIALGAILALLVVTVASRAGHPVVIHPGPGGIQEFPNPNAGG